MPSKSRYGFKVSLQNFVKKKLVTFTFFCIFFIFRLVTFKAEGVAVVMGLLAPAASGNVALTKLFACCF